MLDHHHSVMTEYKAILLYKFRGPIIAQIQVTVAMTIIKTQAGYFSIIFFH